MKKYQANSIYLQQSFEGSRYIKEGQKYKLGFMSSKLKQELQISPNAVVEFKKYQTNRWISIGLYVASSALLIHSISGEEFKTTSFWLSVGTATTFGLFNIHALNKREKAVWYYNQDILR
ncbi:MAG: hypothetical protein AAGG68_21840 [Bacteroidota bacterium]